VLSASPDQPSRTETLGPSNPAGARGAGPSRRWRCSWTCGWWGWKRGSGLNFVRRV